MSGKEKGGMLRRAALFVGAPGGARFVSAPWARSRR